MSHCIFVIMNLNIEPIKNWFGFTRRERRSTFTMLLIIVLIILLRYTIPDTLIALEDTSGIISAAQKHTDPSVRKSTYSEKPVTSDLNIRAGLKKPGYTKKLMQQKTKIDINTSDSATIVRLPGIGPVLSARIIKYRHLLGGFAAIEQLKEVYGLKPETFEMIKGRVIADSTQITRISINIATYKEIIRLPYFEKYEVTAILKYRELKGRITGIKDLTDNKLITIEKSFKVRPYLKFE